jgi:putative hydrolase of the HAD superfamily
MLELTGERMSPEELWRRWLTSPAVREFESGRSQVDVFADGVRREFDLSISTEQFIQEFGTWLVGPYPGAINLLKRLSDQAILACLANTNHLHWQRVKDEMGIVELFKFAFASHEIGALKPDREAFQFAIDSLGCSAERILFLDDNQINVDAARSIGIVSYRVTGIFEVDQKLRESGFESIPFETIPDA